MKDYQFLGNNAQFIKYPFETFLHVAIDNDVKEVDFTAHVPHFYIDSYGYKDLCGVKDKMQEAGITVSCVTPLPYRFNICADADSVQREKTIAYYQQCILAAEYLGAPYVTITASGACYDYEAERLRKNALETLSVLSSFAADHGIVLLLGTVVGKECTYNATTPVFVHLDEIKETLTQVNSPNLKAYMDTEVISLCGETIKDWFAALGDEIKLVRFVDGNYNGYRIWGKGCLPCRKYLKELSACGYEGPLSLHIPGERYVEEPVAMLEENISFLREAVRQVQEDGSC